MQATKRFSRLSLKATKLFEPTRSQLTWYCEGRELASFLRGKKPTKIDGCKLTFSIFDVSCEDENEIFSKLAKASRYVTEDTIEHALNFPLKHNHLKQIEQRFKEEEV